jgi:hypothetical protein
MLQLLLFTKGNLLLKALMIGKSSQIELRNFQNHL